MRVHPAQPIVANCGVGWDSIAMLGAMHKRRIRPDLIQFSDTGGEKYETYAYIPILDEWCRKVGFPPLITTRYVPTRAAYDTLEGKCLANETLPSLAFGKHSCAIVFKHEPMDKYLKTWLMATAAWAIGLKVIKCIGYDNGPQDCRRRAKADRAVEKRGGDRLFDYRYPLQDWGIDRDECARIIQQDMGLPLPMKSACFFCPASKKSEVIWLRDNHRDLYDRAVHMEETARNGRHGLDTCKGLGRQFAWKDLASVTGVVDDGPEQLRP